MGKRDAEGKRVSECDRVAKLPTICRLPTPDRARQPNIGGAPAVVYVFNQRAGRPHRCSEAAGGTRAAAF